MENNKMNSIEKENNQSFELDMRVISDIKAERFLFCNNISLNNNYSKAYTGAFTWDIDKLSYALQNRNIEHTDIIHFLNPQENISCEEVKTLVGSDPNTLVVAMTLLSLSLIHIQMCIRDRDSNAQEEVVEDIEEEIEEYKEAEEFEKDDVQRETEPTILEEENPEEEGKSIKWWIYLLILLPLLFIFFLLWKRRREEKEKQY